MIIFRIGLVRWLTVMLCAIALCSCTSVIAVGTAYDSLAGRLSKNFISYADFTSEQKSDIRQRVAAFHQWHRQEHLPHYRALIEQFLTALTNPQAVATTDVAAWADIAQHLVRELSVCSPLNSSGSFLSGLSDRQAQQIAVTINEKHQQRVLEYESETAKQRLEKRQGAVEKWASRAGAPMNDTQQQALHNTLAAQHRLSPRRHELWQRWADQLINTLEQRSTPEFETVVDQHIRSLWNLTESNYPDEWQANIKLWQNFVFEFIQHMTPDQVQRLTKKLSSLSTTLDTLQKKPGKVPAACFAEALQTPE